MLSGPPILTLSSSSSPDFDHSLLLVSLWLEIDQILAAHLKAWHIFFSVTTRLRELSSLSFLLMSKGSCSFNSQAIGHHPFNYEYIHYSYSPCIKNFHLIINASSHQKAENFFFKTRQKSLQNNRLPFQGNKSLGFPRFSWSKKILSPRQSEVWW